MLESPEISVDQIVRLCEKLRLWVEQNLPYTITIGVGNDQDDIEKVQESYTCAMNALQYKASLGMNRLIEQEDLISMPQGEMFKQLQNIRAICQSFRSGEEDWRDHYQELYWTVKGQMYSIDDLHSLLNYLVFHLHKEMMDLPQEFQSIWNGDIHNQLKEVVDQKETVDESCEEFQRVMQDAFEQMRQLRQSKNNHQLIQKVKWFVSDNYANPDMSLTRLSDEFGLKSGYLSRLFKEEFGVNFSDYLARERINASLLLLAEAADMTVQDIAAAVGYTNTLTFIRTFKKMTGNTPGSYRKELM
jgi:YesN/AraC family two-component response regulator